MLWSCKFSSVFNYSLKAFFDSELKRIFSPSIISILFWNYYDTDVLFLSMFDDLLLLADEAFAIRLDLFPFLIPIEFAAMLPEKSFLGGFLEVV